MAKAKKTAKKKTTTKAQPEGRIQLPPLQERRVRITIVGRTHYIQNRITDKTLGDIEKQRTSGGAKKVESENRAHEAYDVQKAVHEKLHVIEFARDRKGEIDWDKSTYGIPVAALQKCFASTAYRVKGIPYGMTNAAMAVVGVNGSGLVPIKFKKLKHRRGYGKVNRAFHVYHQPVFIDWSAPFEIDFDESMVSLETVLDIVRHSGAKTGIGNNRREKGGEAGAFGLAGDAKLL